MKKSLLFTVLITLLTLPMTVLGEELIIQYENPEHLNYGTEITLRFFIKNKKGKQKELNKNAKDNMSFSNKNCTLKFYTLPGNNDLLGKLILAPMPSNPSDTTSQITISYITKKENLSQTVKFTLNFRGEIKLDFSGEHGSSAKTFNGLGQAVFSNKSHDGQDGGNGGDGMNMEVKLKKHYKDLDSFYIMNIHDLGKDIHYQYYLKSTISQISIASNGGNGGEGSDGTRGSDSNRFRVDGGNAGNGGKGGNAGKILFYLDEKASELQFKIALSSYPGIGGEPGQAGEGVTHKEKPEYVGVRGKTGLRGTDGLPSNETRVELIKMD